VHGVVYAGTAQLVQPPAEPEDVVAAIDRFSCKWHRHRGFDLDK
jgi:hypothetical protein